MREKINIISAFVLPAIVAACTIVMFFIFRPENAGALFYTNMVYTLVLEGIFFGYINVLFQKKNHDLSTPFYAVFGIVAVYYIVAGLAWMLLYSIALSGVMAMKYYIAGLMIITLLWIILSLVLGRQDTNYKESVEKLDEDFKSIAFFSQKADMLVNRYQAICVEKGISRPAGMQYLNRLSPVANAISTLPPKTCQNPTLGAQLASLLDKCEELINQTEDAPAEELENMTKKMDRLVASALPQIDFIKNASKN